MIYYCSATLSMGTACSPYGKNPEEAITFSRHPDYGTEPMSTLMELVRHLTALTKVE
jgi:hypothetical protein